MRVKQEKIFKFSIAFDKKVWYNMHITDNMTGVRFAADLSVKN